MPPARPNETIARLLKRLPQEEVLLRRCLECVYAEFGRSLDPAEVVNDAEDVELGLIWRKHARGLSVAIFPSEIRARQWVDLDERRGYDGPEVWIEGPEDLLVLLRWVAAAPRHGELDYP